MRPGTDRMAAWNLPEASFVSVHRSHRPLIGVTGRVSVGPTCWPQVGPSLQDVTLSAAFTFPSGDLESAFARLAGAYQRALPDASAGLTWTNIMMEGAWSVVQGIIGVLVFVLHPHGVTVL
jgi:hypothetical protein